MIVATTRDEIPSVGSPQVIAAGSTAVMNDKEGLSRPSTITTPTSVLPGQLNSPGALVGPAIIQAAAQSALLAASTPRPLVAIPTADLISHTSFKKDSKFVLRIVPNPDKSQFDVAVRERIVSDAQLFFDRASLQSTAEIFEERYMLFEAFDATTVYLFGKRPKIWTFQFQVLNGARPQIPAILKAPANPNTPDPNAKLRDAFMRKWNMDFCDELIRRYEKYYSGTQALQMKARLFMSYEDVVIEATLLGLVASRSSTIGAANVAITFIVHQYSLMGDSLTLNSDSTLSQIVKSQDAASILSLKINPTLIVPSRTTDQQILATYNANQAKLQASQAEIQNKQQDLARAQAAAAQAAQDQATLQAQADALNAQRAAILNSGPPLGPPAPAVLAQVAQVDQNIAAVKSQQKDATARAQDAPLPIDSINTDLTSATQAHDVNVQAQKVGEAQLRNSTSGDLVANPPTPAVLVEIIKTDSNGKRTSQVFGMTDLDAAHALVTSGNPATAKGILKTAPAKDITNDPTSGHFTDGTYVYDTSSTYINGGLR